MVFILYLNSGSDLLFLLEHILATIIRTQVDIDAMQFGFMPGRGTTDAIFILRQVHEKYLGKHKDLYFAFVDLEKAVDRVPRKILRWALRKVGVDEWLIRTIQAMNTIAKSSVQINGQFSSWFDVQVGVNQGSGSQPASIYHCHGSTISPFPNWLSLGTPLCG